MAELLTLVEVNHADTPRLLLGHSMGGLIACLFLVERQQAFVAAAVSGPAILPAEPPSRFTVWISRFLSRFFPRLGVLSLDANGVSRDAQVVRSEEHTSELQSLMRISYAVFCLKKKNKKQH